MGNDEFRALIDQIEAKSYKYDFEIGNAFREIADEQKLSEEQAKLLEAEFILFRFMTGYDLEDDEKPRFKPVVTYTNGSTFPNEKDVTQERLGYYLRRAKETTNPIMKARYLDINYEYNSEIDKGSIAPELVEAYVEASKVEGRGNEKDRIDCIARAFLVSLAYKKEHSAEYEKAKQNVLDTIDKLSQDNLRWCIELIELMIKHHEEFDKTQLAYAKSVTTKGVDFYTKKGDSFMILESFIKLDHKVSELVSPKTFDPAQAAREDAQLYIDEADSRVDSLFIQQQHLLKAAKILRDAGLNTEANALNKRIEALGKTPEFTEEFQEFKTEQTIPTDVLVKLKEELVGHKDKAAMIAMSRGFMPSWKESKKLGSTERYASISDMVNSITYNKDNMPIAKATGTPKLRRTMRYYDAAVETGSFFLIVTLSKAIEEGGFTIADIEPQLEKIKKLNEDTYESVKVGFEHFFKGNYYEALSILVPQLEDLLGDIVVAFGMTRYRQSEEDLVEYKTLGPILSDLKKILGDDVYHFLHYQLIDPAKENLRNITGHGKLKKTTADLDKKAMIVLQAYLAVLVPIRPIQEGSEQDGQAK